MISVAKANLAEQQAQDRHVGHSEDTQVLFSKTLKQESEPHKVEDFEVTDVAVSKE